MRNSLLQGESAQELQTSLRLPSFQKRTLRSDKGVASTWGPNNLGSQSPLPTVRAGSVQHYFQERTRFATAAAHFPRSPGILSTPRAPRSRDLPERCKTSADFAVGGCGPRTQEEN